MSAALSLFLMALCVSVLSVPVLVLIDRAAVLAAKHTDVVGATVMIAALVGVLAYVSAVALVVGPWLARLTGVAAL